MSPLSGVQKRALGKLKRKWINSPSINERLDTMWALYQRDLIEIKATKYSFQWRKKPCLSSVQKKQNPAQI